METLESVLWRCSELFLQDCRLDAQTCPQFPPFLWNTALIFFMKCCKVFTCTDVLYCASVPLLKVQCYEYHFCTLYNVVELLSNFAAFVCDIDQMTMTQL